MRTTKSNASKPKKAQKKMCPVKQKKKTTMKNKNNCDVENILPTIRQIDVVCIGTHVCLAAPQQGAELLLNQVQAQSEHYQRFGSNQVTFKKLIECVVQSLKQEHGTKFIMVDRTNGRWTEMTGQGATAVVGFAFLAGPNIREGSVSLAAGTAILPSLTPYKLKSSHRTRAAELTVLVIGAEQEPLPYSQSATLPLPDIMAFHPESNLYPNQDKQAIATPSIQQSPQSVLAPFPPPSPSNKFTLFHEVMQQLCKDNNSTKAVSPLLSNKKRMFDGSTTTSTNTSNLSRMATSTQNFQQPEQMSVVTAMNASMMWGEAAQPETPNDDEASDIFSEETENSSHQDASPCHDDGVGTSDRTAEDSSWLGRSMNIHAQHQITEQGRELEREQDCSSCDDWVLSLFGDNDSNLEDDSLSYLVDDYHNLTTHYHS